MPCGRPAWTGKGRMRHPPCPRERVRSGTRFDHPRHLGQADKASGGRSDPDAAHAVSAGRTIQREHDPHILLPPVQEHPRGDNAVQAGAGGPREGGNLNAASRDGLPVGDDVKLALLAGGETITARAAPLSSSAFFSSRARAKACSWPSPRTRSSVVPPESPRSGATMLPGSWTATCPAPLQGAGGSPPRPRRRVACDRPPASPSHEGHPASPRHRRGRRGHRLLRRPAHGPNAPLRRPAPSGRGILRPCPRRRWRSRPAG